MTAIEHIDPLMLETPQELFVIRPDAPAFVPVDAIYCAMNRAEAIISLLMERFEEDKVAVHALDAIAGHFEEVRKLAVYGDTSNRRHATTKGA